MTLYILNESNNIDVANDISVYNSLQDVSLDIEPIDVDNNEYFLFDSDGFFYSIKSTKEFNVFIFDKNELNLSLVKKLISDFLSKRNFMYSEESSVEENAAKLSVESI